MTKLNLDYSKALGFLDKSEIDAMQPYVTVAHKALHEKTGLGNDFLGWIDWPVDYNKEEFDRIKKAAEKIKSDSATGIDCGIPWNNPIPNQLPVPIANKDCAT